MSVLDYQDRRTSGRPGRGWWILGWTIFLVGLGVLADFSTWWGTLGGSRPAYIEFEVLDAATGKPVANAKLTPSPAGYYFYPVGSKLTDSAGQVTFYMTITAPRSGRLFHSTTHYRSPPFEAVAGGYMPTTVQVPPKNALRLFGFEQSNHLQVTVRLTAVKPKAAE